MAAYLLCKQLYLPRWRGARWARFRLGFLDLPTLLRIPEASSRALN